MKITVITVCYNAERTIRNTIESVVNQTHKEIEYIIIDGNSSDNTLSIIKEYANDNRINVLSEPDSGLYNAMNKAIMMATGEYINFMNSGDCFVSTSTLKEMIDYLGRDIVYGDVIRDRNGKKTIERIHSHKLLKLFLGIGRMMSHQSVFTRTDIMKKYMFDENYSICADYDFILRAVHDNLSFRYVPKVIAVTECGNGISQQKINMDEMRKEDDLTLKKNLPQMYYLTRVPRMLARAIEKLM